MDTLKIYLAGKMSGLTYDEMNDWREKLVNAFKIESYYTGASVNVVNPVKYFNFETPKHQTEMEVQEYDLKHVITSDVIIVNLEGLKDSIGTIIELHDAKYHNKIPVIAFGDISLYEELHPWVKNSITRVEETPSGVVEYIRDFYLA